jgi:hypothetical protein
MKEKLLIKLCIATAIGLMLMMSTSCKDRTNTIQSLENVQYIKSWMIEDLNSGAIDSAYAEYYLTSLNETEDLLIKEINK